MLNTIVFALTFAGLCLAVSAVLPLIEVASLAPSRGLRHAWHALSAVIMLCVGLQLLALRGKLPGHVDFGDVLAACVHLLGPAFVLTIAWLSRTTAKDLVRLAGLERAALFDPLTGLPNRRCFDEKLVEAIEEARCSRRTVDLVLLDIDHFKQVNDTFGHGTGDQVLKHVASLIAGATGTAGMACRVGGEEFAVLLTGLCPGRVGSVTERLRLAIESAVVLLLHGGTTSVTASLGAATLSATDTPDSLVERADAALYAAKRAGRNRISLAA